eukprot:NODE_22645_length_700_cov_2.919721.p2 GENE.NODE_22645_length_700_cov_2.919721~~NODE_22645_length_700_cov_2.919721.p2  ORF type:complete len:143 (-),score=33.48 NODE_22645_length_700_cov_2.919721:47-475(-)
MPTVRELMVLTAPKENEPGYGACDVMSELSSEPEVWAHRLPSASPAHGKSKWIKSTAVDLQAALDMDIGDDSPSRLRAVGASGGSLSADNRDGSIDGSTDGRGRGSDTGSERGSIASGDMPRRGRVRSARTSEDSTPFFSTL